MFEFLGLVMNSDQSSSRDFSRGKFHQTVPSQKHAARLLATGASRNPGRGS